jgi:predicted AAA+ superfamily ATPase
MDEYVHKNIYVLNGKVILFYDDMILDNYDKDYNYKTLKSGNADAFKKYPMYNRLYELTYFIG